MAEETKKTKSEYTQKVEALTKQLMELAQQDKDKAERGLIVISVNREEELGDHEEVILSMTGRRKPLIAGLVQFAHKDGDMADVFTEAVKREAVRFMLHRIKRDIDAICEDDETEEAETKEETEE